MLSVIIITLNESQNIARAIKSVLFANEIIVVDSFSTDDTVKIAKSLGATVVQQKFLGYGQQKNFATNLCSHNWIFSLDADEEVSIQLKEDLLKITDDSNLSINELNSTEVFRVCRKTYFKNKWIRHGGWYPDFVNRLYLKGHASWTNSNVHEILSPNKNRKILTLDGDLHHFSFPTFLSQVQTNIKYAQLGSQIIFKKNGRPKLVSLILKPIGKFIECYLIKRGFLDGVEGFTIAINASYSMFMKYSFAYYNTTTTTNQLKDNTSNEA